MLKDLNIKKVVYGSLSAFIAAYIIFVFMSPVNNEVITQFGISEFQYRLLITSILLPIVFIWTCAAYGFVHFKQYALSIKGTARGKGTNTIANGLGIIAIQLTVSSGFSAITSNSHIKNALGGDKGVEIISSDLTIIFALAASFMLYLGASQLNAGLLRSSKPKAASKSYYGLAAVAIIFLIAIVLSYPADGSTNSIYEYVPLYAAIVGVWLPYVIVWSLYLSAARYLHHYKQKAKGKVYKKSLGLLTKGINFILGSSVLIQMLGALDGAFPNDKLLPTLAILYPLIIVTGLGYLLIARSATKLRAVEF